MSYNINQQGDFEKAIKDFLKACLSADEECKEGKELGEQNIYQADYIMPKGCANLNWKCQTLIEIRYFVKFDTIQEILKKFNQEDKLRNHIVLIYHPNSNVYLSKNREDIQILTYEELFSLSVKNKPEYQIGGNLQPLIGRDKEKIKLCKKSLDEGCCTLFLGAGVSMSANLPGWEELLYKILEKLIEKRTRHEDKVFFRRAFDGSNLVMGRYLSVLSQLKSKKCSDALVANVREALYSQEINEESDLIKSVVNLVHYKQRGKRTIKEIITYNYDDLLENAISRREEITPQILSNCDGEEYDDKQIPIYHVHGFLPKYYQTANHYDSAIVLSERTYHQLYNCPGLSPNKVQQRALEENTCLFIGMSMSDPNLRRLLDLAQNNGCKQKHFAFLSKNDFYNTLSFLPKNEIVEEMFYELGVYVIWFDKYEELPVLLNNLTKDN